MAVGSLHSLLRDLPETLEEVPDDEDDFGGTPALPDDGYTITLEEELTHEYEFHTPFKFTKGQFEDYQQTYNIACTIAEQCGEIDRVAELIDIRFNARRMAMEGESIWLEHSPYTDEGAAFMVSLVYAWRGMAEEWNMLEMEERKSARAKQMEEEWLHLDKMMEERTRDILAKMAEKERDGDSAIDAMGFAKIFETKVVSLPEPTGLDKIAAGIAAGQLEKSKF